MMYGKVRKMNNRWKYGHQVIGLFAILMFITVRSSDALEFYKICDYRDNCGKMAVSNSKEEIQAYAKDKNGNIYREQRSGQYQFVPANVGQKGLRFYTDE